MKSLLDPIKDSIFNVAALKLCSTPDFWGTCTTPQGKVYTQEEWFAPTKKYHRYEFEYSFEVLSLQNPNRLLTTIVSSDSLIDLIKRISLAFECSLEVTLFVSSNEPTTVTLNLLEVRNESFQSPKR